MGIVADGKEWELLKENEHRGIFIMVELSDHIWLYLFYSFL